MKDPALVPRNALEGVAVSISVSESEDLPRLGLAPYHCSMAIAELARAIFIAGGTVVYGGRLVPAGFTDVLLDEARRYREDRDALIICLAESEHRKLTTEELLLRQQRLAASADIVCLDSAGTPIEIASRETTSTAADSATALSGMRRFVSDFTQARVVLGGRLTGSQGTMPGILEEALMSVERRQPLYVAGGFGGASCAIARALDRADFGWLPANCPAGAEATASDLAELISAENEFGRQDDGLSPSEREQLAVTHRPSDIASLVVLGLSKRK